MWVLLPIILLICILRTPAPRGANRGMFVPLGVIDKDLRRGSSTMAR